MSHSGPTEGFDVNPPFMVRLTYFRGIVVPRVEIWHKYQDGNDVNVYPWTVMNSPSFGSEEEWLKELGRASMYTFERTNKE